jgi:hypothetical protein
MRVRRFIDYQHFLAFQTISVGLLLGILNDVAFCMQHDNLKLKLNVTPGRDIIFDHTFIT